MVIISSEDEINYNVNIGYYHQNESVEENELTNAEPRGYRGSLKDVINSYELMYINEVIEECEGNISEAAPKLGVHRTSLYNKLKKIRCKIQ